MKTRIGILGMGGVGGYFGGLLAKAYAESDSVEIIFIARGETQKAIAQNGLKIICSASSLSLGSDESEMTVFPSIVSDDSTVIGKLDYLICATKTYDIEESLLSIKKSITKNTVILPLYNGVDAPDRISDLFPDNEVLQGCVYIVSMAISSGVIKKIGPYEKLFFGSGTAPIAVLNKLQKILKKASIESYLVDTIEETVWEKFVFISALASATSYLDQNIGGILNSQSSRDVYLSLLNEITMIAAVKGLNLPADIIMQTILKLEKTPHDATSSMHRDLMAGRKIELFSLTEFVVNEGAKYEIETPTYQMVLEKLLGQNIV
jgi:2-dehydropantoate 2-reductase